LSTWTHPRTSDSRLQSDYFKDLNTMKEAS